MRAAYVQLGAYGDILNALPIIHDAFLHAGRRPQRVAVSRDYAALLDGCSYVEPVVLDLHYGDVAGAVRQVRAMRSHPHVLQVWGHNVRTRKTERQYQRQNWANAGHGMLRCFGQRMLHLDRRSEDRERSLLFGHADGRPMVLTALSGRTSDFCNRAPFLSALRALLPTHNVVDLSPLRVSHPHDLLGLMDAAEALVTIDTMHSHLAQASSVPVVQLYADDPWLASVRRPNHIMYMPYSSAMRSIEAIAEAVSRPRFSGPITHVHSAHTYTGASKERHERARATWSYKVQDIHTRDLHRSGVTTGDRDMPFVRDLLAYAFERTSPCGAVILTNGDIGLLPETDDRLRRLLAHKGAAFCWRRTHNAPPVDYAANVSGSYDGGMDMIAVTAEWWRAHGASAPDQLFGRAEWDVTWRDYITRTGGGELYGTCWHIAHDGDWTTSPEAANGNAHNMSIHAAYMRTHDLTRACG